MPTKKSSKAKVPSKGNAAAKKSLPPAVAAHDLRASYIFIDIPEDKVAEIARISTLHSFSPGSLVLQKDKKNDSIWFILEGKCVIRDLLPGGLEVDLFSLNPGDIFGEMSYADHKAASATVVAQSEVRVARITFDDLDGFFKKNLPVQCQFLKRMNATFADRLRNANNEIRRSFMASMNIRAE